MLYNFDKNRILVSNDTIFLYKLMSNTNDAKKMYKFIQNQTDNHIYPWGMRYTFKQCVERVKICDSGKILLCFVGKYTNDNNTQQHHHIIGIIGYNYYDNYFIPEYSNCYFTHIIIDINYLRKGYALSAMSLLLKYLKDSKLLKNIYAAVYNENNISINLHKKIDFIEVINKSGITIFKKILDED